jgi:ATP-dependent DNA helicase PIF1
MIPTDMPFEFKRLQFHVRLAFAMTINKAQGQSLYVCGLNLENQCFSHGQLYVACSRVGKPSDLLQCAQGTAS